MNPLLFLRELATDAVIERLGWVLVHSLWQFALVALVAAVVVRWLVPGRAAARYAVLVGALATIVACPALTWRLQPVPVVQTPTPVAISHPTLDEAAGNTSSAASDVPVATIATTESGPPVAETVPAALSDSTLPAPTPAPLTWWAWAETELRPWLAWIVVAWSCGVVLCSLRPLVGWHALWRLRRVGVSPVGEEIAAALRRVARQLGLRRAVQVLQSTLIQTPVLIGYFRPAILLPVGLVTGLPIAQLEAILAHELAHVRRHDFVVNLLQTLVETLCFYHPAIWWLSRQIRIEREHCCDDLVVGLLGNRVEYGRALLAVEELRGANSVLAIGMADGALLSRVRRLVGENAGLTVLRPAERWIVLVLAAVGLCVTLVAVRTGMEVVREADSPQFSITLPNGTVVELLGVATGEADSQWWSPDGTLLEKTPLPGLPISSGFEPAKECRSFAVRIRGKGNDDALIRPDGARQYQSSGRGDPAGIVERVLTADVLSQKEGGTLRVGVERGEFGPPQPISPTGEKLAVELPADLRPWYDAVELPSLEEFAGNVRLVFSPPDFSRHWHFVEWRAVDMDGASHLGKWGVADGKAVEDFGLPRSRLKILEYRLQPWKHWVTFENVSLQPGEKTVVTVSTKPPPRPDAFVARLPGDIAVELVGVGFHPSKDKPWWKPDGSPLEPRPDYRGGFLLSGNEEQKAACREFLFHIRGLDAKQALAFKASAASPIGATYHVDGLLIHERPAGPFNSWNDDLELRLTSDPFGPSLSVGTDGVLQAGVEVPGDLQPFYDRIVPQRVTVDDGRTVFTVQLQNTETSKLSDVAELQFEAVDTEGKRHQQRSQSAHVNGEFRLTYDLPRDRIDHFEYRLRPYRHRVTFQGVSLEPGRQSDVKVSVETVAVAQGFPPPAADRVRGLKLEGVLVRTYSATTRLSPEQQVPELLTPDPDPSKPFRRPKNVFQMPLAENIWLKYPAGTGHFYINDRPDGTWEHERLYGPIPGDPFEVLQLEAFLREQLQPGRTGGDARYRLTLMFRTGDPGLIRRAWNLAEPELAAADVEGRLTERDPLRFERLDTLERVRDALQAEAEAFRRPELTDVVNRMRAAVAAVEAAVDALNDAVPAETYESVTDLQSGIQGKIPDALWGPPLDGLRLGLVPRESINWAEWQKLPAAEEFPATITARAGDELLYQLLVENVSDREIRLCGYVVGEEMGRGLDVLDRSGRPVFVNGLHTSIRHFLSYWRMKPGERRLLPLPAVHLAKLSSESERSGLGYFVEAAPGEYTLRCRFRFGHLDNERHRYVPGKSEWIGELSTGAQTITIAAGGLGAATEPVADPGVSLADAVRDFNAENVQRGRGQDQPPLTEEEVLKAISQSDWKRDAKDVSEREFAAFKAVAKTRRLPEGAKLEVLTGVQSDAFTTSQLWSIRLIMPALERAGTVGFSIRHKVLSEEKIDPQQVAWGRPDADGLSLGLFLSPKKPQYRIGERVQLRLFVRNEGRKAIEDLTFMNITWPVIEDFTLTDQTGARVAVRNGHEEWSGPQWIAGAIQSGLEPGDVHALRVPFEIGIGGDVDKLVGRILDAKPGQTLRLRVRAANGSERMREAEESLPESGEVTFSVQTQTAAVDDANNPPNRPAAPLRTTLTGHFVYDGEPPARKDLYPQFAQIDATQRQPPGPDGRFSGVEATYREFLKQNIRPSTLDPSLLVDKAGGVANVVIWVTSKEIPWTPPADLAQRPVMIRLQDGNFAPRMTVATVGQPVLVENHDPVPFHFHAEFLRALNSPVNVLLPARSIETPQRLTLRAAEPFPARFQSDIGPWANGWLMMHGNPYVAVSRADGSFALPDLPPGEWEFRVWHERSGYVRHWPQGRFKRAIQPGENDLGTIRLKPEVFGVPAAVAGSPPANREPIGEVGGKPVYRDEITDETLHSVFLGAALERYREAHRAEIAPTDAEIRSAGEYFDRKHRERLAAAGGEAKLREQLRTIETQLATSGLPDEDQQKLELEHLRLRSPLRLPSEDRFAEFMLRNWKLQKHLYDNYGGGRILWQQAGLEAIDAMRRWMEAQEQAGVFKITDTALRARFYEYWTRDHGPFLTADKERIRKEFLEPEWLAPTPAKASPSAD